QHAQRQGPVRAGPCRYVRGVEFPPVQVVDHLAVQPLEVLFADRLVGVAPVDTAGSYPVLDDKAVAGRTARKTARVRGKGAACRQRTFATAHCRFDKFGHATLIVYLGGWPKPKIR